jgi:hypothetical protein
MSLPTRYLIASAAFAACAAGAYAQTAKPETRSEVRIIRDGDNVQVVRDGRSTVIMRQSERRRADRAEHLRAVLQLRPNQEAALTAYVAALQPAKPATATFIDGDGAKTTPERLAAEEKLLDEHVARMRATIAATRTFYDQLDPAQKRAFDELHEGPAMMVHRVRFDHPLPPIPPVPPPPPPGL